MIKRKKSRLLLIFLIIIIILIKIIVKQKDNSSDILYPVSYNIPPTVKNYKEINVTQPTDNFYAKIEIPEINIKEKLVPISSEENNVNKSIEILFPSKMPDKKNSILILAAHSGNSKVSYFKNLNKLNKDNKVFITYNNIIYIYKLLKVEKQLKNGAIEINRIKNNNMLVLTTCDPDYKDMQLILIFILEDSKNT